MSVYTGRAEVAGLVAVIVFAASFLGVRGTLLDLSLGEGQGRCSPAQSTATSVMHAHNGLVMSRTAPNGPITRFSWRIYLQ
jgi:hypothetical protein